VEDLWLWDQALYEEKLLPKAYLAQIFSQQISDPDYGGHYGYGWSLTDKPLGSSNEKIPTVWHDGVIDGFCAVFTRIPSSQSSVILLSNIRRAPLNAMTRGIMGILYDQAYDFPLQSVAYSLFEVIDTEGLDKGIKHFESIKADPSYYLVEDEMNIISYRLLQSDRGEEAVAVLRLAIEAFPNAFNLYDSLGEVLKSLGQKEEAIKNYQKSIELNPNNENGKKMLEELLNG
ncbi:MAG: tetratricopeptide repeat protein, partial [Bacteroidota bacterium]